MSPEGSEPRAKTLKGIRKYRKKLRCLSLGQKDKLAPPVRSVRILPVDTLKRGSCERRNGAFQWNYYAKPQNWVCSWGPVDLCRCQTGIWTAAGARFQLPARQSRECPPEPSELPRRHTVSCQRRRRQYAGGYQ